MSGMLISLEVSLLYRVVFTILCFLFFHMKLIIVLAKSMKNSWDFDGDWIDQKQLNLLLLVGSPFFIMLIIPIQEHERSFHFLVSSSISFFKNKKFLLNRSFTSLVSVTTGYFMLFVAIVKCDVSVISFSAPLLFVYRRATDFFLSWSCILSHYWRYLSALETLC